MWLCALCSVLFSCVVSSSTWLWEGRRVKRHHQCPQPSPRQLLIDGSPVHAILPIAADHCIEGIESIYMKIILRTKLVKHHRQSPQPSPMLFFADISEGDDWICTVPQERLQPMSDGKRHFFAESLLCYSYKLILIGPGIFHRALFEK